MLGALGWVFANWKWIGSAALAAFLSFQVTAAFKDRDIAALNLRISKDHTAQESGRADFWKQSFADLAKKKDGERRANEAAERKLAADRDDAVSDMAAARLQLDKERKLHAQDAAAHPLCIGSGTLRLRLDEAGGAADPGRDTGGAPDGGTAEAVAGPGAGTSAPAEAACITPDQLLTGYLNLAGYARTWGEKYDVLREWSLDPLGMEHDDRRGR